MPAVRIVWPGRTDVYKVCAGCGGKGIRDIVPSLEIPFSYRDDAGNVHMSSYYGGMRGLCPYCRGSGEIFHYKLTRGVSLPPIVERRK